MTNDCIEQNPYLSLSLPWGHAVKSLYNVFIIWSIEQDAVCELTYKVLDHILFLSYNTKPY